MSEVFEAKLINQKDAFLLSFMSIYTFCLSIYLPVYDTNVVVTQTKELTDRISSDFMIS